MDPEAIAGRYRRQERLGVGGMAEVWSADDLELERKVAIKLLGPGADRVRFEREARAAASLSHPNICQLFDYGETEGRPFMVLEYLPGGTLEDRIPPGMRLPDEETARIAGEVAAGLAHAHARGLVHRDLKPSNILFDSSGHAKIADFGIARLGAEGTITEAGTVLGTAAYLSPEQAAGEPATPASDVYSFGVILYRLLSGRLPFEAENPIELVRAHRDEEPAPLRALRSDAPPALEAVAMAALAKEPGARPADGEALLAELDEARPTAFLPGGGEDATQVLPFASRRPGAADPRPRRRRAALALAAGAALVAAGIGVAFATTGSDSGTHAPATTAPPSSAPSTAPPPSTAPTTTAATTAASTAASTGATTTDPVTTGPVTTEATTPASTAETEPVTTAPTTAPVTTTPPPVTTEPPSTVATTAPTTEPATTEVTTTEPPPSTTTLDTTVSTPTETTGVTTTVTTP